jgi:hypothetical protein
LQQGTITMKQSVIINTDQFQLISYGNGLCYALISIDREASIFFQESDAEQFRQEREAYESMHPQASTNAIMSRLWFDYEALAEPLSLQTA